MEATLKQHLEDTRTQRRIHCQSPVPRFPRTLGCHGSWSDTHAGVISVLAQQAAKQTLDPTNIPVVCLESDNGNIRIQKLDGITAAVPKMAS
ncbi:unnamed protein product [Gulo gulo]|uniref:Ragulator complex protein LAMTOR5 n=1 Tax=Gulo gulo TaxID=48420 RepID=A0A9X9PUF0_GULGU|nr:unnamed protein product [Gulo gulo]